MYAGRREGRIGTDDTLTQRIRRRAYLTKPPEQSHHAADIRLFMALTAVRFVLHVKGLHPVMATPAELALAELTHVHLVSALCHVEH